MKKWQYLILGLVILLLLDGAILFFAIGMAGKKEEAAKEILEHADRIVASDNTFVKQICRS